MKQSERWSIDRLNFKYKSLNSMLVDLARDTNKTKPVYPGQIVYFCGFTKPVEAEEVEEAAYLDADSFYYSYEHFNNIKAYVLTADDLSEAKEIINHWI